MAQTADEQGHFAIRVPYWTSDDGVVGTGDAAILYVDEVVVGRLRITEADVREGRLVEVVVPEPDLEEN